MKFDYDTSCRVYTYISIYFVHLEYLQCLVVRKGGGGEDYTGRGGTDISPELPS